MSLPTKSYRGEADSHLELVSGTDLAPHCFVHSPSRLAVHKQITKFHLVVFHDHFVLPASPDYTNPNAVTVHSNQDLHRTAMIRVKDPEKSLSFYQDICGMKLLRTSEQKEAGFTLYFLGYPGDYNIDKNTANGVNPLAGKEGILELTWNYGTEKESGQVYHNGNDKPQGMMLKLLESPQLTI